MAGSIPVEESNEMAIPSYLHSNPIMRWMANQRVRVLMNWLDLYKNPTGNILDFGCGTGILFNTASANFNRVFGVDLVLKPAKLLIDHYNLENISLLHPDALETEIKDSSIDIIV